MECLSPESDIEEVVLMKGAQLGATQLGTNWLGFTIHHAPGPFLYVEPRVEDAKRVSKQRVATMIASSPALASRVTTARSRDSGNTILMKEFDGGFLMLVGANSGAGFRQVPIRYLFLDDIDGYPDYIEGEGDPVDLGRQRTATFKNRKIFVASTPTIRGGRIDKLFDTTDQRRFFVTCPACGHQDWIRWGRIRWPEGNPEAAALECEKCGALTPERKKPDLLAGGEWRATAAGADPRRRGYHISALYSPLGWKSWAAIARDFLGAKAAGWKDNGQVVTNTLFGEAWEEQGDSIQHEGLFARREQYQAAVPLGVLVLTAGVDVQDDRLELEIVGWGIGEESWGIDYLVLSGAPEQEGVWQQLDAALAERYEREDGAILQVACAGLDTAYATQEAYEYARRREDRGVRAVRGMAGAGRPIVSTPVEKRARKLQKPVRLFTIGVDGVKGLLYSRLRLLSAGAGYCHFPIHEGYDPEFFEQLTAEKRVIRYHRGRFPYHEWVKSRPRNEALDCRVYATAAMHILNPAWQQLAIRVGPPRPATAEKRAAAFDPRTAGRPRVHRGGFVNRWRNW